MRSPWPARMTEWSPTTEPPRSVAKPIVPSSRGARMAVAHPHAVLAKRNVAALGRRLAEQQCGAGWRIDLVLVVHFENLDIEIVGAERLRRLFDQNAEQVDAKAHIAGFDDDRMTGRCADLGVVLCRAAGRADDVDDARLRGEFGKLDGRGRRGEIEHAFGLDEGRKRHRR